MAEKRTRETSHESDDDISPVLDDFIPPHEAALRAFIGGKGTDTDCFRSGAGAKTYDGKPGDFHV
jgi:hypothetical protein